MTIDRVEGFAFSVALFGLAGGAFESATRRTNAWAWWIDIIVAVGLLAYSAWMARRTWRATTEAQP